MRVDPMVALRYSEGRVFAAKPLRRIAIAVPKGTRQRGADEELRGFLEMAAQGKMKRA